MNMSSMSTHKGSKGTGMRYSTGQEFEKKAQRVLANDSVNIKLDHFQAIMPLSTKANSKERRFRHPKICISNKKMDK